MTEASHQLMVTLKDNGTAAGAIRVFAECARSRAGGHGHHFGRRRNYLSQPTEDRTMHRGFRYAGMCPHPAGSQRHRPSQFAHCPSDEVDR